MNYGDLYEFLKSAGTVKYSDRFKDEYVMLFREGDFHLTERSRDELPRERG